MAQNGLYNIIFQRKSIRNYDLNPLDDNVLKEIREHLNTLKPYFYNHMVEFSDKKIIYTILILSYY